MPAQAGMTARRRGIVQSEKKHSREFAGLFFQLCLRGASLFWTLSGIIIVFSVVAPLLKKELARSEAHKCAAKFGGENHPAEAFEADFNHMWELTWRAVSYADENHDAMQAAVKSNLSQLKRIASEITETGGTTVIASIPGGKPGLTSYRGAPARGRYVVFSDIHITDRQNRQNFFERNKPLYLDVLRYYYAPHGWSLIENGDIEELLIFEPDIRTMPDFQHASWDEIIEDRATRKLAQFRRIIADHEDYYRVVHDHFIARGAYWRTIGNHDYDLAKESFASEIASSLGIEWPRATDMVGLCRNGACEMLICHGHQFDAYCVAEHAERAGESFSQGGAWAFQGPDRHWTMEKDGAQFITPWQSGGKTFANMLVTDEPGKQTGEFVWAAGKLLGNLHNQDNWEALFGKNVAWEYFMADDPQHAYDEEVLKGKRWYKYRHMNELLIAERLEEQFPAAETALLLGHSHEPRIRPGKIAISINGLPEIKTVPGYINSAAAGRFENLIWGVEIDDGAAAVVSWSKNPETGKMIRTVWEDRRSANWCFLQAVSWSEHEAAPVRTDRENPGSVIPAITNLMLA